jgi:hypothetical protein
VSEPFLTTKIANMRVAVELAWGANLTDLTGATWVWSDITADVLLERGGGAGGGSAAGGGLSGDAQGGGISITLGRPDFSSETQTAEMVCQLNNLDGRYSEGGMSANWPNVRRGTPARVRVSSNGGTDWFVRFQGIANGFTPQWDAPTGRWATVTLSASGPLRRLNQGTGIGISAMREGTIADSSVVAYIPCEDRQHASFIAPAVGTASGFWRVMDQTTDTLVDGLPGECASYGDIPSSAPIVTMGEGGGMQWNVPDNITSTASTFTGFFGNVPSLKARFADPGDPLPVNKFGTEQIGNLFIIFTHSGASVKAWSVSVWPGGLLWLSCYNSDPFTFGTSMVINEKINYGLLDNTPYEIGLSLSQSGSTTNYNLFTRQIGSNTGLELTGSKSSNSNGAIVTSVVATNVGDSEGLALGHFVLRNTIVTSTYDRNWANGYPGETVTARLTRLGNGHGIPITILDSAVAESASIADKMGPQYYDTLTVLLRECELTGQGVLYDGLGLGLTYVTKKRRETNANSAPTLTIDATQLMEPFAPINDDQLTINHADAARRGGTTTTYSDLAGPSGVNVIGDYSTTVQPNTATDTGLVHYAEWAVNIGTQQGYRYPSVSFALEANSALISGWLACTPQSRIDVTNVAAIRRQHPIETIKLLLEGWHEEIDAFTWRVTANASSALPWNVVVLAAATGSTGDGVGRLQTVGSQLNTTVSAGVTSISVRTNSGNRWVTTADDGGTDNFPFDIDIGGIKATVTGVTGTGNPQTFTLSAALPRGFTGSTTPGAGVPIKVWRPPVFGL